MKYFPALFVTVLAAGLAGCGSGVQLPPVEPDQVEVFMPGSFPTEDIKVISRIEEAVDLSTPDREVIEIAKERAAQVGADAVVITSIRRTSEGQVELNLEQEQQKILEAMAVYFPSRHPELSNK